MKIWIIVAISLVLSCTDELASRRALENQGFTEIRWTGYEFMACSEDDTYHTGFSAKNSQGKMVSGVVCCGLVMKACTVRW